MASSDFTRPPGPDPLGADFAAQVLESILEFAVITLNMEGRITSWNPGAEKLFGFAEEHAVGRDAGLIFTSEDCKKDIPRLEIAQAMERGRAIDERWHVHRDGRRFWADGMLMPMRDALGKTWGFVKILKEDAEKLALRESIMKQEGVIVGLRKDASPIVTAP